MSQEDVPVVLDDRKIYEIKERTDHDRDMPVHARDLGEDWGNGFFVKEEPVVIDRNPDGSIRRLRDLSDVRGFMEQSMADKPIELDPVNKLSPIPLSAREKLAGILAMRLFKWYAGQAPRVDLFNPLYDGIPDAPPGAPEHLQPTPETPLVPATPNQVYEWLKTEVIGPRVQLINKRRNLEGFRPDIAMRINRDPVD